METNNNKHIEKTTETKSFTPSQETMQTYIESRQKVECAALIASAMLGLGVIFGICSITSSLCGRRKKDKEK